MFLLFSSLLLAFSTFHAPKLVHHSSVGMGPMPMCGTVEPTCS